MFFRNGHVLLLCSQDLTPNNVFHSFTSGLLLLNPRSYLLERDGIYEE